MMLRLAEALPGGTDKKLNIQSRSSPSHWKLDRRPVMVRRPAGTANSSREQSKA